MLATYMQRTRNNNLEIRIGTPIVARSKISYSIACITVLCVCSQAWIKKHPFLAKYEQLRMILL